jgi:hypothetical protein
VANEPWLNIAPSTLGVLVTADDGAIGTQAWDAAELLPNATVYYIQHWPDQGRFSILLIHGTEEIGAFGVPALGDEQIPDIKGQRTPEAILQALGIPPELVGFRPTR